MAGYRQNQLSLLENEQVKAFCTTGLDFAEFKGKICKNLFEEELGIEKCVFMNQIHSNKVEFFPTNSQRLCDGLITNEAKTALCVLSADCLPLLLWHKSGFIAALHSGRKGCFENILKICVCEILQKDTRLLAKDFTLIIAPSICVKNYELAGEVLAYAKTHFKDFVLENKLDLKALVAFQAKELGIENILDCGICSFEDERFFSYRLNKSTKRFASIIYLKA